ncbi:MAG: histidinol dehydrogenase [Verrucomicrobiota bacterium]|nr:histidinol dehydrogenase [Verrucomicrobiota bacterium]
MRHLRFSDPDFVGQLTAFCREAEISDDLRASVAAILADVRGRGDEAVAHYTERFDGAKIAPPDLRVSEAELAAAWRRLPAADRAALRAAHANIVAFNRRNRPKNWMARNKQSALVGEKFDPIRRVGLYVPGGQAPLVSTVLMTATLARIAGCPEIAVCTPPGRDGRVADGILAALYLAGVREIYKVGGVQAVGALACGTATIPAVDKIFGPGNAYVCEAKRQVFGAVGIDSLPGPSEVMVVADRTARPDFIAADLLAQAEHGSGKEKIYLVATSADIIEAVSREIDAQLKKLSRAEQMRRVLESGYLAVEARTSAQIAEVANFVAPEHLELMTAKKIFDALLKKITTAGAIMIGHDTPTVLGDFTAGPSHVLPTGRAGRFFSGLRIDDFLRRTSVVRYDGASAKRGYPVVAAFSRMEQLDAHGRSLEMRLH